MRQRITPRQAERKRRGPSRTDARADCAGAIEVGASESAKGAVNTSLGQRPRKIVDMIRLR
jgi:hypothetical protein